jgi:uncharacterized phiE125 gp8 family phage protein
MGFKLISGPTSEPVTLAEIKAHLRIDFTDDDEIIGLYLAAARQQAEKYTGCGFIEQTWDLYLDAFPHGNHEGFHRRRHSNVIEIAKAPLLDVIGVFYLDGNGDEQELSADLYDVDVTSLPARIVPVSSWPSIKVAANAVRVQFTVGFKNADSPALDDVPAPIKAAILLTLGHLYANRESVIVGAIRAATVELPQGAIWLLNDYRAHRGMA